MRAMLSVLRIPSYMVSITADDATYVRPEWASPHQFNHCIIAIKVTDETKAPSVVLHPTLGRLMIFDATDPYTPLGDLPEDVGGGAGIHHSKIRTGKGGETATTGDRHHVRSSPVDCPQRPARASIPSARARRSSSTSSSTTR